MDMDGHAWVFFVRWPLAAVLLHLQVSLRESIAI